MKLFNIFKYLSITEQPQEEQPYKYNNGLDGQCVYEKDSLFYLLCFIINYDLPNPKIINNIEDIRELFYQKWKNMPIPFQQTYNVITKEKLHKVIYQQLHNDNITIILETIVEHYNEKKEKKINNNNILEYFEKEEIDKVDICVIEI